MKKIIRDIGITFIVISIVCVAFWKIGWLTSVKEIYIMFIITGVVIPIDLFASWIWRKLIKRQ